MLSQFLKEQILSDIKRKEASRKKSQKDLHSRKNSGDSENQEPIAKKMWLRSFKKVITFDRMNFEETKRINQKPIKKRLLDLPYFQADGLTFINTRRRATL